MLPKTIDEFMDLAKKRQGLPSDRQLAFALGVKDPTTTGWRKKRQWPRDSHMTELANLCEIDVEYALMELNAWRAEGSVRSIYERIAQKIAATAAVVLLLVSLAVSGVALPTPANAKAHA